jgi:hypothetical protein
LIELQQRSAARLVLRGLSGAVYRKAVHYEFLARAFLELKQYKDAADACHRAEALRQAEEEGRYKSGTGQQRTP